MSGYIQIYEENIIIPRISKEHIIYIIVTDEKKHLKTSEIVKEVDKLISTLVIGTFVVSNDTITQIFTYKNKILEAYVINGIITIINEDDIIYNDRLGENDTLNIGITKVNIIKTQNVRQKK